MVRSILLNLLDMVISKSLCRWDWIFFLVRFFFSFVKSGVSVLVIVRWFLEIGI